MQAKYPHDTRNGVADETLTRLADEASNLSDEAWQELSQFYNWSSGSWNDAVSLASRRVEFQCKVRTFSEYVNHLISILSEQNAEAVN
jgi:hypothetical protein